MTEPRKASYHVHSSASREGGWVVRKEGARRPIRRFALKRVAIHFARWYRSNGDEIVIHRRDGTVGSVA